MQIAYKDTKQYLKPDSLNLNKIKESYEILKKENQNLKRLLLSYELNKEKAEENQNKLKLKVYRQEKENKTLMDKLHYANNIKQEKMNDNSKCYQFESLSQKNSTTIIRRNNHCPLLKKNVIRTRSSSRKNSLMNETKHIRTRSLLMSNNHSFFKPKRNRSALDISSMSRNQQGQYSSRLATERAVIKSYYNAFLVKKPKQNIGCVNWKMRKNDIRHNANNINSERNDFKLSKKKLHPQI